jgi:hypothetical protein
MYIDALPSQIAEMITHHFDSSGMRILPAEKSHNEEKYLLVLNACYEMTSA